MNLKALYYDDTCTIFVRNTGLTYFSEYPVLPTYSYMVKNSKVRFHVAVRTQIN